MKNSTLPQLLSKNKTIYTNGLVMTWFVSEILLRLLFLGDADVCDHTQKSTTLLSIWQVFIIDESHMQLLDRQWAISHSIQGHTCVRKKRDYRATTWCFLNDRSEKRHPSHSTKTLRRSYYYRIGKHCYLTGESSFQARASQLLVRSSHAMIFPFLPEPHLPSSNGFHF